MPSSFRAPGLPKWRIAYSPIQARVQRTSRATSVPYVHISASPRQILNRLCPITYVGSAVELFRISDATAALEALLDVGGKAGKELALHGLSARNGRHSIQ